MTEDRQVHAFSDDMEVVRYDKAGKWFVENEGGARQHIGVKQAARIAWKLEKEGKGEIVYGLPGGRSFEKEVDKLRAASSKHLPKPKLEVVPDPEPESTIVDPVAPVDPSPDPAPADYTPAKDRRVDPYDEATGRDAASDRPPPGDRPERPELAEVPADRSPEPGGTTYAPSPAKAEPGSLTQVGPHEFKPIRRFFNKGRCRACYLPESDHPVKGYTDARPLGDRSPARQ